MKEKILYVVIGILIAVIGCFVYYHYSTIRAIERDNFSLITALNDTVSHYKTKNGEQAASIRTLEFSNAEQFLKLTFYDTLLIELQSRVAYYKKQLDNVTIFDTEANMDVTVPTASAIDVKVATESIRVDTFYKYPTYRANYVDEWVSLSTVASLDSTSFKLWYRDSYSLAHLKAKDGNYVEIVNRNPYAVVDGIRSFKISSTKSKAKRFGLSIYAGYGLYLHEYKNQSGKEMVVSVGPEIGIGLTYDIFQW